MQVSFQPHEIITMVSAVTTRGQTDATVCGIAALNLAQPGDLSFLGSGKYRRDVPGTRASVVLVPPDYQGNPAANQLYVVVANPSLALTQICNRLEHQLWPKPAPGIHPTALVAPDAKVAASSTVGPFCIVEAGATVGPGSHLESRVTLGRNARVGQGCWLMPGCTIRPECELRDRVRLHPGVVVGADGFGYDFADGRHQKVPQVGSVLIENDVEVGANTTIDRARFSRTIIGEGTKIDNLVQIGHNVTIGKHCILCAQVGISGSVTLEDYVVLGGQAGVAGHLKMGRGVQAGGKAGIASDVPAGSVVNGNPAISYMLERRLLILHRRLPELFERVGKLEARA